MLFCCYFFQAKKCTGANVYAICISDLAITYPLIYDTAVSIIKKLVASVLYVWCEVSLTSRGIDCWLWADPSYCDLPVSTHFATHTLVIKVVVNMGNWDFFIMINNFLLVTLSHTLEVEMVVKMGNWDFFIAIHFCLPFVKYSFLCNFHRISFLCHS